MAIYEDVNFDIYTSLTGVNISSLKHMRKSVAHYVQALQEPQKDTPNLLLGSVVHCLILEPEKFDETYKTIPILDKRTKAGKEQADILARECDVKGLTPVSADVVDTAKAIVANVEKHPFFKNIHDKGCAHELTATWMNKGIECKGRIDCYNPNTKTIIDIKTTKDASQSEFAKACYYYGYINQAAWYLQGLNENGLGADNFIILAIEKEAPHCCAVYRLNPFDIGKADEENNMWLEKLKEFIATEKIVGYPEETQELNVPLWALNEIDKTLNYNVF